MGLASRFRRKRSIEAAHRIRNVSPGLVVAFGKSVGAETEFVPYPGKARGCDFSDTDPVTADAIDRVARFFQAKLAV